MIHSAFALPCEMKTGKYQPLREEILSRLCCKYKNLQILAIDEISMVEQNMIMYISERLKQIKQNQSIYIWKYKWSSNRGLLSNPTHW